MYNKNAFMLASLLLARLIILGVYGREWNGSDSFQEYKISQHGILDFMKAVEIDTQVITDQVENIASANKYPVSKSNLGVGRENKKKPPNIFLVLVDDWGWNDVGYHRKPYNRGKDDYEIDTPNIDNLVKAGLELNRHYTYNYCSPTRSSLQSGRLPVHVVTKNVDPASYNPKDPVSGYSGIPRNMTGVAEKLRSAGYKTHMTGKWDCGMATYDHTPMGRGYDTFFGYYHHANDYYDQTLSAGSTAQLDSCYKQGMKLVDLWDTTKPAFNKNSTVYEEEMFTENSVNKIMSHDTEDPFFLFHSFHIVHTPLQVPIEYEQRFSILKNKQRRKYAAMVQYMDHALGKMVAAFQAKGMWENTLMIVSSDNGGPIYGGPYSPTPPHLRASFGAANNLPLRGGKISDWEGGVRVNAFVSGGVVSLNMRGKVVDDYIHVADWYATLCDIAGVDPEDKKAAKANLPPVDSISMWPLLSGKIPLGQGPRSEIHLSENALISGNFKIVTGADVGDTQISGLLPTKKGYMNFDGHYVGWGIAASVNSMKLGRNCKKGCLFNINQDPNEDQELTKKYPEKTKEMFDRLQELNKNNFSPDRGDVVDFACKIFMEKYKGFYGPFIDI